jgi:hypothetical protein
MAKLRYVGEGEVKVLRKTITHMKYGDTMEPEIQNFILVITKARELQEAIEAACFQAYVHIEFHTATWTWGAIRYRLEMSGAGVEVGFANREEMIENLELILRKAQIGNCENL